MATVDGFWGQMVNHKAYLALYGSAIALSILHGKFSALEAIMHPTNKGD